MQSNAATLVTDIPDNLKPPFERGFVLGNPERGYRFTVRKNNKHYFVEETTYQDKLDCRAAQLSYINTRNRLHNMQNTLDN